MLVFAASMDGQGAIAIQAGRDYARIAKNPIYILLTQVRFGRFEDILEDMKTKTPGALSGPVWEFAQGYAQLRAGNPEAAKTHLAPVLEAANTSTALFGANPAKKLFGVLAGILEGEIALTGEEPGGRVDCLREGGLGRGLACLGRTRAAAFQRAPLARRRAARDGPSSRGRDGLPRRSQEAPAQRLVAPGPLAGARGAEETGPRGE